MSEKLGLEEFSSKAGAVQVDKSFLRYRTLIMDPLCQYAFARTGFAGNQHRTVAHANSLRLFGHLVDCVAGTEKWIDSFSFLACFSSKLFLGVALILKRPLEHDSNRGHFYRLGQELLSTLFDSLHSEWNATVSGKQNHGHSWVGLF